MVDASAGAGADEGDGVGAVGVGAGAWAQRGGGSLRERACFGNPSSRRKQLHRKEGNILREVT